MASLNRILNNVITLKTKFKILIHQFLSLLYTYSQQQALLHIIILLVFRIFRAQQWISYCKIINLFFFYFNVILRLRIINKIISVKHLFYILKIKFPFVGRRRRFLSHKMGEKWRLVVSLFIFYIIIIIAAWHPMIINNETTY
jgi:hypothetical protein